MDIQQNKFQTVSHCVDLDNDSGKKVLVSVSICHINKCDGCDPSGEKGVHKTSCAWNILTNETCQVHEVNSKGCPIHDTILNREHGIQIEKDQQNNETSLDSVTTCAQEDGKNSGTTVHESQTNEQQGMVSNVSDDSGPAINLNLNIEPGEEKEVAKSDKKSSTDPPDPPKDDGGSGGGPVFVQPDELLSPDIPLQDASNVQNMVSKPGLTESLTVHNLTPVNIGTSLNFEQIQKHSGSTTCSYVYVDKLGENLSTRLPNIITEALASSALHLKDDASIPECLYEPYQKITALTLEKIQQLKNKIYQSADPSAQVSTDIYKVQDGKAIYIAGKASQSAKTVNSEERDSFLFRPENMITIENPNIEYSEENMDVAFEEIDEGIQRCPVDENVASNISNQDAEVMQDVCNSKTTYECCCSNGPTPVENVVTDHVTKDSSKSEESVNAKTTDILIDRLSEISNTNSVMNELKRPKKMIAAEFQNPLPLFNVSNRQYEHYIESLSNEKKMITSSTLLEVNNLNNEHIDILTTHNTYRDSDAEEHSFLKSIGQTVDNGKMNSCNCVKNKFHSCGHSKNLNFQEELVSQMIQTDEVKSKHTDGEEDEQDEEELRAVNTLAKKELSDENYKLLSHIIEKVKQNAAEISSVLKSHNMRVDSEQEFLPINVESPKKHNSVPNNYSGRVSRQRFKKKPLIYGSKLVLSPEIPNEYLNEEMRILEQLKGERLPDLKDHSFFSPGKMSSIYVNLYKDIIRNSSFLKSLIPPISSNGLFSDAVECHLNEQKRSLIPWLISLFIPTCECTTSKDKKIP
ncbi:uncharacterized protein LOC106667466 [Cimex lectularius]|uniref:Uncharacterized protein n=1 Tax=Cimex lectularius TaxID=79782 RepID=A0A8I6TI18_CIMLE|nr:uncharacterized protein LOC106667466 [Cimex lectularius]